MSHSDSFWDNRDFFANRSEGHGLVLKVSRDFGQFDSSNTWIVWQSELDKETIANNRIIRASGV